MATLILYEDNPLRSNRVVSYHSIRATQLWLKHYDNMLMLMLEFFAKNETDFTMRRRAEHELTIARRKMEYFERHQNFNQDEATRGSLALKKR